MEEGEGRIEEEGGGLDEAWHDEAGHVARAGLHLEPLARNSRSPPVSHGALSSLAQWIGLSSMSQSLTELLH